MVAEGQLMQVQAYSALSFGIVILLEGEYELLKEHVHFLFLGLGLFFALANWIRLIGKSMRVSAQLPKGERISYFWLGHYTDEYLQFVSQRALSASFLFMTCYLVMFWIF